MPHPSSVQSLAVPILLLGALGCERNHEKPQDAALAAVSATESISSVPPRVTTAHPNAVANSHLPGDVDVPALVPFIVKDPGALRGIVVDETQAELIGAWQYSTHTPPYVGIGYLHDQKEGKGTKSVTYTPRIPEDGVYEVRLSHCYNVRRSTNTPVLIRHAGGDTTVRINQQDTPEYDKLFRSLGSFAFLAGEGGFVQISTDGTDGKYVIADAVQFLPAPETDPLHSPSATDTVGIQDQGKKLFASYCAACHQKGGQGVQGRVPPLDDSPWVSGPADRLVRIVLNGLHGPIEINNVVYNLEMPAFRMLFSDHDIAAILTYVRQEYGAPSSAVSSKQVAGIRESTKNRKRYWTVDELTQ